MDCYYVTGASRGIGKAIVENILEDQDTKVIGISRSPGIEHPRYRHRTLDLTDMASVQAFRFDEHQGAERAVLINNAALLSVSQVGNIDPEELAAIFVADALAPAILTNQFVKACQSSEISQAVICNMTSRAGTNPTPGGAAYCSAKAALEMFTRTAAREAELKGDSALTFLIANPGEVDTDMQSLLVAADADDFPYAEMVRKRKADGLLATPQFVAERLVRVLRNPALAPDMRFDVQALDLDG